MDARSKNCLEKKRSKKGGGNLKISIEGKTKEIAALVLELQERPMPDIKLIDIAKGDPNNLIDKEHDIAEIAGRTGGGTQTCIR